MADDNEERSKQAAQDEAAEAALAKAAAIDENASFGIEEGEVNKIALILHMRPPTCFILFSCAHRSTASRKSGIPGPSTWRKINGSCSTRSLTWVRRRSACRCGAAQARLAAAEKASLERRISHLQHELDSAAAARERLHEGALHAETEMRSLRASIDEAYLDVTAEVDAIARESREFTKTTSVEDTTLESSAALADAVARGVRASGLVGAFDPRSSA